MSVYYRFCHLSGEPFIPLLSVILISGQCFLVHLGEWAFSADMQILHQWLVFPAAPAVLTSPAAEGVAIATGPLQSLHATAGIH